MALENVGSYFIYKRYQKQTNKQTNLALKNKITRAISLLIPRAYIALKFLVNFHPLIQIIHDEETCPREYKSVKTLCQLLGLKNESPLHYKANFRWNHKSICDLLHQMVPYATAVSGCFKDIITQLLINIRTTITLVWNTTSCIRWGSDDVV